MQIVEGFLSKLILTCKVIYQVPTDARTEVTSLIKEGGLVQLLNKLNRLIQSEKAKGAENLRRPKWRPSGIAANDYRLVFLSFDQTFHVFSLNSRQGPFAKEPHSFYPYYQ